MVERKIFFALLIIFLLGLLPVGCDQSNGDDDSSSDLHDDDDDDDTIDDDDNASDDDDDTSTTSDIRVPAEWETHTATWMQWPGVWEMNLRPAFARLIDVIQDYEPVHILTGSEVQKIQATQFLANRGVPSKNITWHVIPIDNSWMRDNGPIYVTENNITKILDFKFDGWGGNFGAGVTYSKDNQVPCKVADHLGLSCENRQDYVLEKGNLEFNGDGTLVLNWDCQDQRNPGMSQSDHEELLKKAFGVTKIIWAYGHDPADGTTGHIDGTARFIDAGTIVISNYGLKTETDLVTACEKAGLKVLRYNGDPNWLVGNGFVVAASDGDDSDTELKKQIESFFPGRIVHLIDVRTIWNAGGGIHCVTNDQPK